MAEVYLMKTHGGSLVPVDEESTELVQKNKGNMNDMIHCIWYCVSGVGDRFETEEENFIRSLAT